MPLSIGIGLVVSLFFSEAFGIAAGGLIVPGYFALSLTRPQEVALTVGAGFVTYAVVRTLASFLVIYGRRRTVLMILVGYLVGMLVTGVVPAFGVGDAERAVIGFIIPGLIAIWLDRQGVVETVTALVTASVVVRLVLILLLGAEVPR
ncbi:MAG TPA: poly-gamma-glutamate biosynthesis protein PgsC [Polyangiaceae bacterium]|nr:poly-gamma-glutamate biosynthesis protein PgsC [Polyangiaceae bacterium]